VAGIRTPQPISKMAETLPSAYKNLIKNVEILEGHYGDMQDIEFTIQEGQLFMLQTRGGKRTGAAAVKIAVDMVTEGLATTDQAITMVKPEHLNQLLHPQFVDTESASYTSKVVATGLPASPGAAVGRIVFTSEAAEAAAAEGHSCILVRDETSPEDVGGMWAAQGVLTARGGMTSHAAVVARGWGKPCICGCDVIFIDEETGILTIKTKSGERLKLNEGDMMSINGETGEVLVGTQELHPPNIGESQDATKLMGWVDAKRTMRVMANADNGKDAAEARRNGAQ
ncbi:PEP-utilizing enzyme, mobile domain-containing protein, partial [Ochromonadaceae sp. CCMP2298]